MLLEDDAVFQCQVGAADGVAPIRSRDAILTVNVPPEKPIIINGDTLRTTEDREVEIKCVSRETVNNLQSFHAYGFPKNILSNN